MVSKDNIPSVEDRIIRGLTSFHKVLSENDSKAFLELIEDDEPNQELKREYKRYRLKTAQ